jgi:hypothetical protein
VRVVTCSDYQFCASYNLFSSSTSTCHWRFLVIKFLIF